MTNERPSNTHVRRFLKRFGYVRDDVVGVASRNDTDDELDADTRHGLVKYQRFHGLTPSGVLDDATRSVMKRPRCGLPDPQTGIAQYSASGTYWTKRTLVYAIGPSPLPAGLTLAQVENAIAQAFALWSAPTGLTFTKRVGTEPVDIEIFFATGEHGDGVPFDGAWNVLAHAFYPSSNAGSYAGDVHFDNAERWTVSTSTTGDAVDLVTVAAHEFGHSLGLGHSSIANALMYPMYSGAHRHLAPDDVAGIQSIYGASTITLAPTAQHVTDERFVFLIGPNDNLYMISRSNTGSKRTELHVLSAASGYRQFILQLGTALHETDATFDFAIAPNRDLFAIKKRLSGSGTTEVHVISAASNYQRFVLHTRTVLHETDASWSFAVAPNRDVLAITRRGLRSVEVHTISVANAYQRFGPQLTTPLPITDTSTFFAVASNGNVAAIRRTGSAQTKVDILSAASRYQSFTMRTAIPIRTTAPAFEFGALRQGDLLVIQKSGTTSGATNVGIAPL